MTTDRYILYHKQYAKIMSKVKNNLPNSISNEQSTNIINDTFFKSNKSKVNQTKYIKNKKINDKQKTYISCKKVNINFSNKQKIIIDNWFRIYTKFYNHSLKYIFTNFSFLRDIVTTKKYDILSKNKYKNYCNFRYLRTKLKDIKQNLLKESIFNNNKNTQIYSHTLDEALKQLVTNLKSAVTNLLKGKIHRFRLKYWKLTRPSKSMHFEKTSFNKIKNSDTFNFAFKKLGKINLIYNRKKYNIKKEDTLCDIKLNFNAVTNKYTFLIPIKKEIKSKKINGNIFIDPGMRTFMTGISEKSAIKIGVNVDGYIYKELKRLNKIKNNCNIKNKIKKKNERLINRKIKYKIDELHWKTINYLTNNYQNIFLGDMSAKDIVRKEKSVMYSLYKDVCLLFKFYVFQQRLKYKCESKNRYFELVNERYTSKTCSFCGNYKSNLKKEKIYNCSKCKKSIDRDINGARNIYVNSMISIK